VAGLIVFAFSYTIVLMFINDLHKMRNISTTYFFPVPKPSKLSCPFLKWAKNSSAGAVVYEYGPEKHSGTLTHVRNYLSSGLV
jgi:hypothetical protein